MTSSFTGDRRWDVRWRVQLLPAQAALRLEVLEIIIHLDNLQMLKPFGLYRDTQDETKCLMSLTRRENNCVPLGFQLHRYRTKNGQDKSLLSITDCGCQ